MAGPIGANVSQRIAVYYLNELHCALVDTEQDGPTRKTGKVASTIIKAWLQRFPSCQRQQAADALSHLKNTRIEKSLHK